MEHLCADDDGGTACKATAKWHTKRLTTKNEPKGSERQLANAGQVFMNRLCPRQWHSGKQVALSTTTTNCIISNVQHATFFLIYF